MEGVGFEPTKAKPADLQSAPVDRLGTPPDKSGVLSPETALRVKAEKLLRKSVPGNREPDVQAAGENP